MYLPRSSSFQFIEPKNFIFLSEGALGVLNIRNIRNAGLKFPANLRNSVVNY